MSEVAIYDHDLTAAQVQVHWGFAGGPPVPGELFGGNNTGEPCLGSTHVSRTGHPVETEIGNFWHTFDDLSIPGRGIPLAFSQTYNSMAAGSTGPLGYGWTHSYAMSLEIGAGNTPATVHHGNGAQNIFTLTNGVYSAPPRVVATLTHNGDGSWTFLEGGRVTYTFDAAGRLTAERDLNGYTTTLGYTAGQLTSVTDPAGRALTLTYDANSLLSSVADGAGRSVHFGYDTSGNLTDITDVGGKITHMTYDVGHRMVTMLDPRQAAAVPPVPVINDYDASGRVDWQSDFLGRTTTFDYTTVPGSTLVTDAKGNETLYTYRYGALASMTKGYGTPSAATWSYYRSRSCMGPVAITDPNGHTTSFTRDGAGNPLTTTDALGRTTTNTYNARNQLTSTRDPKGVTTTLTYDSSGNLVSTSTPWLEGPAGSVRLTTYVYGDPAHPGDVTSVVDPNGKTWTFTYDAAGNVASAADPITPTADVMRFCYDAVGRRTAVISPLGSAAGVTCSSPPNAAHTAYTTYDAFGRPLDIRDPLGHVTHQLYDDDGNVISVRDPMGHLTTNIYDAAGELTTVNRADGTTIANDYWPDGSLHHQYDGLGRATTYDYDPLGHLTSVTDPLGRTTGYTVDPVGNLKLKIDPGVSCSSLVSGCTSYSYDAADQLTGTAYHDATTPDATFSYDADGNQISALAGASTVSMAYDSLGRMTVSSRGGAIGSPLLTYHHDLTYHYDLAGRITSMDYPSDPVGTGTVQRVYDAAGRLTSVADWNGHVTQFGYDADGNLTSQARPDASVSTLTYDGADQLANIADVGPQGSIMNLPYTRDANGQIVTASRKGSVVGGTDTYAYNSLNQVTGATASGVVPVTLPGASSAYGYDAADNLTHLDTGLSQRTLAYDTANEVTSLQDSAVLESRTFAYDTRGNRTTETSSITGNVRGTYVWDRANRLLGGTSSGTSLGAKPVATNPAPLGYDGTGLRSDLVWDRAEGMPLITAELQATNPAFLTNRYITGPGGLPIERIDGAGNISYYHADALGSTRAVTDSSAHVLVSYRYDPYGKAEPSNNTALNPFQFAGQYTDSTTGLIYMRARWYDPSTGQFLSRDPIAPRSRSPYAYAGNDPLNFKDPSGLYKYGSVDCGGGNVVSTVGWTDEQEAALVQACWSTIPGGWQEAGAWAFQGTSSAPPGNSNPPSDSSCFRGGIVGLQAPNLDPGCYPAEAANSTATYFIPTGSLSFASTAGIGAALGLLYEDLEYWADVSACSDPKFGNGFSDNNNAAGVPEPR
jgi:RHS repeat-associated protein